MPVIDRKNKKAGNGLTALNTVSGLLLSVLFVNYLLWIWRYAAQTPVYDDYVLILNRLIAFHDLPPAQIFGFFFDISGVQHRLVFLNLVIVAIYKTLGSINFHTLVLIGNCSLLVLLLGIWKHAVSVIPDATNRIGYFLPVALLILSPAYFEASLWATGVLQNLPVLMFSFLAVACATQRTSTAVPLVLFAALLASGSSANGIAAFLACAAVFASQRRFAHAGLMAFLFIAIAWAYTRGLPSDPSNFGNAAETSAGGFIAFFLALCGAMAWGKYLAILLGTLLVAGFVTLTWRGLARRNPVLWGLGVFLLLSMGMMSVGRAGLGLDAALLSRYKPYSGLMLIVIYLGALIIVPSISRKKVIGFLALIVSGASYISYFNHYDMAITDFGFHSRLRMAYRSIEGKVQVSSGFPGTDFSNYVIDTSERYGAYHPPTFPELIARPAPHPKGPSPLSQTPEYDPQIYEFIDGEKASLVYGIVNGACANTSFQVVLKNDTNTLHFNTQDPDWGWLNNHPDNSIYGIFGVIVDKRPLAPGIYRMGVTCGDKEPVFSDGNYLVSKKS